MINDVMEAVHEVPRMLVDWARHDVAELRTHLGCSPASRWSEAPNLVSYIEQRSAEYGCEEKNG
jgi:hypothetical protein